MFHIDGRDGVRILERWLVEIERMSL